jgi:hypothetical protein
MAIVPYAVLMLSAWLPAAETTVAGFQQITILQESPTGGSGKTNPTTLPAPTASAAAQGDMVTVRSNALHFLYQKQTGDFEFIARIPAMSHPETKSQILVGVMVREDLGSEAPAATLGLRPWLLQDERVKSLGGAVWVKAQRNQGNVGVYYSIDGIDWRYLDAGRTLSRSDMPVYAGVFVQNPKGDVEVSASFDHMAFRPLKLDYATSWVGADLPGTREDKVQLRQGNLAVIRGGPDDGLVLGLSSFDEQGHPLGLYKDGRNVGRLGGGADYAAPAAAWNASWWLVNSGGSVRLVARPPRRGEGGSIEIIAKARIEAKKKEIEAEKARQAAAAKDAAEEPEAEKRGEPDVAEEVRLMVTGVAADEQELFVSNPLDDRIEVWKLGADAKASSKLRDIPFPNPGRLALDAKGGLWAIQDDQGQHANRKARVVRLDRASGKELAAIVSDRPWLPKGLSADQGPDGKPRLLVADNGPDQQVKIYEVAGTPRLSGTLGLQGGVWALKGRIQDEAFAGLNGVATDAKGRIYVTTDGWRDWLYMGGIGRGSRLLCFDAGKLAWKLDGFGFIDNVGLDPQDGSLHMRYLRLAMDWGRARGGEWSPAGWTWDPAAFPHDPRNSFQFPGTTIRRIGGAKFEFKHSSDGDLAIYRYDLAHGEIAIPCGFFSARFDKRKDLERPWAEALKDAPNPLPRSPWILPFSWQDGQGGVADGTVQKAEVTPLKEVVGGTWSVDRDGDLWNTRIGNYYKPSPDNDQILQFPCTVKDGIPTYGAPKRHATPAPFTGQAVNWSLYDKDQDALFLMGATPERPKWGSCSNREIVRYDGWSQGTRTPRCRIVLPYDGVPYPGPRYFFVQDINGFAQAGDFVFAGSLKQGIVHVYDARVGNKVLQLIPGPEANAACGDFDFAQAVVTAYRRPDGEYAVFAEEDAYAKIMLYRWRPAAPEATPTIAPTIEPHQGKNGGVELLLGTRSCGIITGFTIYRSADGKNFEKVGTSPTNLFSDPSAKPGITYHWRAAIVNSKGEGPHCTPVLFAAAPTTAKFLRFDATTQGDWKANYGSGIALVVGDPAVANPKTAPWATLVPWLPENRDPKNKPKTSDNPTHLQAIAGSERYGSYWKDEQRFALELSDGKPRRLAIYCQADGRGYGNRIEIIDGNTGRILDTQDCVAKGGSKTAPPPGQYAVWEVSGRIHIRISKVPEAWGIGVAGVFVD